MSLIHDAIDTEIGGNRQTRLIRSVLIDIACDDWLGRLVSGVGNPLAVSESGKLDDLRLAVHFNLSLDWMPQKRAIGIGNGRPSLKARRASSPR